MADRGKKGGDENTKIWISIERKELFGWNKKNFQWFWRAIIWWKIKVWKQLADTSFNVANSTMGYKKWCWFIFIKFDLE